MVVSRNPLVKSSCGWPFLAEVPLPDIRAAIILVLHQLWKNPKLSIEWHAVPRASVDMRPRSGHQGRPRRCADRVGDVGPLEDYGFRSKLVEIRGVNFHSSVSSESICPLLIGQKPNQI